MLEIGRRRCALLALALTAAAGCGGASEIDAGTETDAGTSDLDARVGTDARPADSGDTEDAAPSDDAELPVDAGPVDAAAIDAEAVDASTDDAGLDAGAVDAGSIDAGAIDASTIDASGVDGGSDAGLDACRPEICNGLDDDCDSTVDEGCPIGIQWFAAESSVGPMFGDTTSPSDTTNVAGCAFSNPLIGLCGTQNADGSIRALRAVCGAVAFRAVTTTTPYGYELDVTEFLPGGARCEDATGGGPSGGTPWAIRCPTGMIMDSISGLSATPGLIGTLSVGCSRWVITQDASSTWLIDRAETGTSSTAGSGPGTPFSWMIPDHATTTHPGAIRTIQFRYRLGPTTGTTPGGVLWLQPRGASAFLR